MNPTSKQQIAALTERVRQLEQECNVRVKERDAARLRAEDLNKSVAHASHQITELRDVLHSFTNSRLYRWFMPGTVLKAKLVAHE